MNRTVAIVLFLAIALPAFGQTGSTQNLRGPVAGELTVEPAGPPASLLLSLENIVLVDVGGDSRLLDAIELELLVPSIVAEFPGAISFYAVSDITRRDRNEIAEISGRPVFVESILRAGKSFFQISVRTDADIDASAAIKVASFTITPDQLPLAISFVPVMKGLTEEVALAEFTVTARPVTRNIGLVRISYQHEDGSYYEPDSLLAPNFALYLDNESVQIDEEYLMRPGLHSLRLESDRFEDRDITVGVDAGSTVDLTLPLVLALATVNYTAPRGSRVFVDGEALDDAVGDFTLPPGEHTIVVIVEDYTVTRRFSVEEGKTYTISLTMNIEVEEAK